MGGFEKVISFNVESSNKTVCLSISLHLLCHVGLREVVEDKSNLLLDILWRFHNPFCLVSGHEQCVNVGGVY